jgi:hypothetical protein
LIDLHETYGISLPAVFALAQSAPVQINEPDRFAQFELFRALDKEAFERGASVG